MVGLTGKAGLFAAMLGLVACGSNREVVLSGERVDLRDGAAAAAIDAPVDNQSVKIALGAAQSRDSWTTVGGGRLHASGHNAFTSGAPSLAWTSDIGQGKTRKLRLTVPPVSAQGLVIALDSEARLTALSAASGAAAWSVDLTPLGEKAGDASGGALAIAGDVIYASIGYGDVIALDLKSGTEIWRQRLDAAGAAGLAVYGDLVYAVAGDGRAWAIERDGGRVKWTLTGPETVTSRVGAPSPVVTDRLVVFPFASGDLFAAFRKGGIRTWSASIAGQRQGVVYANISDISADPVVVGSTLYVGNQSGRFAAFDVESGARTWTAREGAYSPALVLGGSVFIVSDRNALVRLSAKDGSTIWKQPLPFFTTDKERRQKDVFAHYGPVAAGGKLWVASSDGLLRGFDPASGAQAVRTQLPDGAAADPIVVGGVMYILLENGAIAAYR